MQKKPITNLRLRTKNLEFGIARTKERVEEVYNVVNKVYRQVGYIREHEKDMYPDKYSEYSTVFYAMNKENGRVVGSLRFVNNDIGLPLEDVFDISNIKSDIVSRGGKYVEVGTRVTDPRPHPNASFGMMALWYQYLVKENISDSLISIHVSDRKIYERAGFKVIEKKFYKKVHSYSYFMHADTKKWLNPYKEAFLQTSDNIILD